MFKNLSTRVLDVAGGESEIIELALSYGFRGIELDIREFAARVQANGMDRARRLLDSAKLNVGYFALPVTLEADDETFKKELTGLAPLADLAAQLGCTRSLVTIAPASDERPYHENFEFHRRRLSEVAAALEHHNVRLGVGFAAPASLRKDKAFEFIHNFDALLLLLGMLGQRNVGVALDVWEVHVGGGNAAELIRKLPKDQLIAVSLADLPSDASLDECTEQMRLAPGEGGLELPSVLASLAETGYDGPVTPAPHRSQLESTTRDAIVKATGQALDKVWKEAGLSPAGKLTAAAKE